MSETRSSDWTPKRRALAWFNVVLQAVLLLALLVVVNLIARNSPKRFDLTQRRSYQLSNQTEDFLKSLPYDVEIWLNSDRYSITQDKSLSVALQRTQTLLEEFKGRTRRLTVNYISAGEKDVHPRFRQHWNMMTPATLYILATLGTGRTNKKAIEIQQLFEGDPVTGEVRSYRGESVLVTAIRDLGGGVRRIVYESAGHQEFMTADKLHMGGFRHHLTENEGIDFRPISLIEYKGVPTDCELLVIMGPIDPFQPHEIEVIRDYLERGGNVLVAVRPKKRTGLEKLLEEYSVVVGDNLVYDSAQYIPPRMTNLLVKDFNLHEVNRSMVNLPFIMPESCTIDPVSRKDPGWRITPLAMTGENSWESKGEITDSRPAPKRDERRGSLKLIVAVEKTLKDGKKAKLDVWGSVMPFTNDVLYAGGSLKSIQMEYVINHFRWLMDRSLLNIAPEKIQVRPLQLTDDQISQLKWIVLLGFPLFGVALGLLAWFVRRK